MRKIVRILTPLNFESFRRKYEAFQIGFTHYVFNIFILEMTLWSVIEQSSAYNNEKYPFQAKFKLIICRKDNFVWEGKVALTNCPLELRINNGHVCSELEQAKYYCKNVQIFKFIHLFTKLVIVSEIPKQKGTWKLQSLNKLRVLEIKQTLSLIRKTVALKITIYSRNCMHLYLE